MELTGTSEIQILACQPNDAHRITEFIEPFVLEGKLLPRTCDELTDLLPFAFIAESEGRIVGFVALEVYSRKLAEIRSLAVSGEFRRRGVGRQLVERCVACAKEQGIFEVMAITSSEEFFQSCGFDFTLPGEKKALFLTTRPSA